MIQDPPRQQPEGKLLQDALQTSGQSIRQAAAEAGMSDTRWRQIVKGSMHVQGVVTEVIAPAHTLARMAHVVGIEPDQLIQVGRHDAAAALRRLEPRGGSSQAVPEVAKQAAKAMDEIQLIYDDKKMTAKQKLELIRKVLILRAEADQDKSTRRPATNEQGTRGPA